MPIYVLLAVLIFTFSCTSFFHTSAPSASVIGQWRGENRDGMFSATNLLKKWPEAGPQPLWAAEGIGQGWSSVVVADQMLFVTGSKDGMDNLTALDSTGHIIWQVPLAPAWNQDFPLARCTPTVADGKVYFISSLGQIMRIDAASGEIDWQVDGGLKFAASRGVWGTAESPLLVDDMVIYTPAGPQTTIVALDKDSGATRWQSPSLNDTAAYVSPIAVTHGAKQMIITVTANHALGVDSRDGTLLWKYAYGDLDAPDMRMAAQINTVTPLYSEGQIYITSGYNHVGAMLKLSADGSEVNLIWKDTSLDCHHGGVVKVGNYIYGANWLNNRNGNWVCLDWNTGETMYEEQWISKGSIVHADGMLYCYAEKRGYFGLVQPTPSGFALASSFQIEQGDGQHWSHPTIANGTLYVRHGDVVLAYNLSPKPAQDL